MNITDIKTQIENTIKEIKSYKDKVLSYKEEKEKILSSAHLTQDGKRVKMTELSKTFEKDTKGVYDVINQKLTVLNNSIIEIETKALDFTDEKLIKSVDFINAIKNNITDELLNDIVKQFIGNKKALNLIQSIVSSYNPNISWEIFDKYTESIEPKIKKADNAMYFAIRAFDGSIANIKTALNELFEIAEILGIEIKQNEESKE